MGAHDAYASLVGKGLRDTPEFKGHFPRSNTQATPDIGHLAILDKMIGPIGVH